MSESILKTLLNGAILKGDAKRGEYVAAFSADVMHIATANNRAAILSALAVVPAKRDGTAVKQWAGFTHAVGVAIATIDAQLPGSKGWIGGAGRGPFAKASQDARAPYLAAHAASVAAFDAALATFPEWVDKAELSEAEKAEKAEKAKTEKAEKAEKVRAEALRAAIESGEVVRADSLPVAFHAATLDDHIGAITGAPINSKQASLLRDILARFELAQLEAAAQGQNAAVLVKTQRAAKSKRAKEHAADMADKPALNTDMKTGRDDTGRMSRDIGETLTA